MLPEYYFKKNGLFIILGFALILFYGCQEKRATSFSDYPIEPVAFTKVNVTDNFWASRMAINHQITIPIAFRKAEETGRIDNFRIAGNYKEGSFCSLYPFDDSDVYKNIEAACYSMQIYPDPHLNAYLDSLIDYIAAAQEDDGYLYTNRTIDPASTHEMAGKLRWENEEESSHELYNAGHLYEAAVAHFEATGKHTLLSIAIKNANLVDSLFGWGKIEKAPGHQEIEIGLVKLFRVTGERKYLDLAKFFLDVRGPEGGEYNQMHEKAVDQHLAVGHAVRAQYMYAAMADIAAITGEKEYLLAIDTLWSDVVSSKTYLTGGIGSVGSHEGFGEPYDLPNMEAYCETCAAIANALWNYRMFLLHGDSKYFDVFEKVLYNGLLSGVSLSGDQFFYPNPLASAGLG
ncbi:MAG: glycoside hydrolase family 127 protein [Sphingobacterium sp.]|nr:glycoside hydrolase family 127 protein [Sphingobacterium sp.]